MSKLLRPKLISLVVLAAVCLLSQITFSSVPALASIPPSNRFWGEVTICGEVVPSGTVVTARVENSTTGPSWTTTTFMDGGKSVYVIDIPPYEPPEAGGVEGEDVYFSIFYKETIISMPSNTWTRVGQTHHPLRASFYLGDANMDGEINAGDITKLKRIIFGLDPITPSSDANGDGVTDVGDMVMVRRIFFGLEESITC